MPDGYIRIPNSIVDRYEWEPDKIAAWVWIMRNRNYETGMPTCTVRKLSEKYGWSRGKSHDFLTGHFPDKNRTKNPPPERPGDDVPDKNRTNIGPEDDLSLCSSKKQIKLLAHFNRFWAVWPVKKNKANALKAFNKLSPDDSLMETILSSIAYQKEEKARLRLAGEFCPEWPHASTWLNGKRWEDEIQNSKPIRPVKPQSQFEQL